MIGMASFSGIFCSVGWGRPCARSLYMPRGPRPYSGSKHRSTITAPRPSLSSRSLSLLFSLSLALRLIIPPPPPPPPVILLLLFLRPLILLLLLWGIASPPLVDISSDTREGGLRSCLPPSPLPRLSSSQWQWRVQAPSRPKALPLPRLGSTVTTRIVPPSSGG